MAFTKKPGGWYRNGESESDPFFLGLGLDDLEDRIEAAVGPVDETPEGAVTIGNDVVGSSGTWPTSGSHSFVVSGGIAPYRALATAIRMYFNPNVLMGAGTQPARGVVYNNAGIPDLASGVLLGAGTPVTLTNPTTTGWVTFPLPASTVIEDGDDFSFGVHFSLSGSINQAMVIPYAAAAANTTLSNNDVYENGTASPFGTLTAGYSWLPALVIDIEPAPEDLAGDIEALDARVDDHDTRIDALEDTTTELDDRLDDLEAASSTVTALIETATALDVADVWTGDPIEDVSQLTSTATSDVAGTLRAQILDTTWKAVAQASVVDLTDQFAGSLVAVFGTGGATVRLGYTNGGTVQAEMQIARVAQ